MKCKVGYRCARRLTRPTSVCFGYQFLEKHFPREILVSILALVSLTLCVCEVACGLWSPGKVSQARPSENLHRVVWSVCRCTESASEQQLSLCLALFTEELDKVRRFPAVVHSPAAIRHTRV